MAHFCQELADWWPLFSPPAHYVEEAEDPGDYTYTVDYACVLREPDGRASIDPWQRDVFMTRPLS